jgi:apolipoprotein N-acyltransferase
MRRIATFIDPVDLLGAFAVVLLAVAAAGYDWRLGVAVIGGALLLLALSLARTAETPPASPPAQE